MRPNAITHYLASGYVAVLTAVLWVFSAGLILLVRAYQAALGPVLGGHCRFQPTCSNYAIDAIRNCGPIKGLRLAVWRVLRCHPLAKGGYDPTPEPPATRAKPPSE